VRQTVRPDLGPLAALFFKLGCLGFGGPAAHLALMEREIVQERRRLSPAEFLDLIGAANLIPGVERSHHPSASRERPGDTPRRASRFHPRATLA